MNVHDYLIDQAGLDWPSLLEEWRWLLPPEFCVWLLTRAGDLFITLPNGSVHMLDVGAGTLQQVAESRDEFLTKIDEPGVADNWLMIPIIDRLVASRVGLSPSQCYSFQLLPVLGGKYTPENRTPLPIREHFGAWGSIHEQLKGLPDGSRVVLKVVK
jgi:hypothetical protein